MKKFLMYVVVLVTVLFIGYTTYYFVRNNENIYLTLAESDRVIYLNVDESLDLPIVWTKPYSTTKVYENVVIADKEVVSFDIDSKKLVAKNGGLTTVEIKPSNEEFGPFTFTIAVGDGTVLNPYYVKSDLDLLKINKEVSAGEDKWELTESYALINDIDLISYTQGFAPIGSAEEPFSGTFNGNGYSISNLKILQGANAGLFAAIGASSVVENITFNTPVINGSFNNAGTVAGINNGTIRSCFVNDLTINNTLANSNNGGIAGNTINNSNNNKFASFGYIDMCSVSVNATTAGNFGGIVGSLTGSVVYNSKSVITKYTQTTDSIVFGGIVGVLKNAQDTSEYMFSVIKNSLCLVNSISLTETTLIKGIIVGKNQDEQMSGYHNILEGLYYYSVNSTLLPVGSSNVNAHIDKVYVKSLTELCKQATYQTWDFENVWKIEEDSSVAQLRNFDESMPQALDVYIPGQEITNDTEFLAILDSIKQNPQSGIVYQITSNVVVDFNNAERTTIAPDPTNPITASIVCNSGVTVTLKNAKISGENSSFFGYISGINTSFNNIIFENITVSSSAEIVAVVATGLLDNATLKNCEVKNCNIETTENTKKLAVVVGLNQGKVLDVKVNSELTEFNTIASPSKSLVVGGIVAENSRLIENCTIESYEFVIETSDVDATLKIGGIAGYNTNNITNCYNYSTTINTTYYGNIYAGGVVGYLEGGNVLKCFSEGLISVPFANENSYVGGIAAYAGVSSIKQSYYALNTLQAYNVAGIAFTSYADIDQCSFNGEAKGVRVAGLVGINNKNVKNCTVLGILTGMTEKSKASGLVSELPVDSSVKYCFSNATFAGLGEKHAETESEFRATIEKVGQLFGYYPDTGSLTNCIVINYGEAYVKGTVFGWIKQGWIECSDEQAKGLGDYSVFKNDAEFDQDIWTFDNNEGLGAYPTLTYLVQNPYSIEYYVTVDMLNNGKITADCTEATYQTVVTLVVTPDEGYKLKEGSLKANGINIDESTLTFVMPQKDVVITAEFIEL